MTAYSYNNAVPAANNDPSVDQPQMLVNTQSINSLIGVDHVSFNSAGSGPPNGSGGHHLQVTFDSKNTPGAVTDPVSVLYTANGTASAVSELFYRNQNGILPISPIKAFGNFDINGTRINGTNILLNSHPSTGRYIFDVTANILAGTAYTILITPTITVPGSPVFSAYIVISATQFEVDFYLSAAVKADPEFFSICVMQL